MFFSVGGGEGTRPTLFELVATEGLLPGLKDAVVYSLGVFEPRRPALRRIVDRQHETFAVLAWWIERQSLRDNGASFAETLYGLKRCNVGGGELSQTQKKACLLTLVAAPYVQAKLEAWHEKMRARRRPAFGLEEVDLSGGTSGTETSTSQDGGNAWEELVLKMYPKLRSFQEGLKFLYQFTYLMGLTDYSSPLLHLLQVKLMRASGVDLLKNEKMLRARREKEIQVAKSHRNLLLRKLHEWPLRVSHAMADNLQYTLMACVFGFKLLEWWFTTVEEKMKAQKMLPVPPPPPIVEPAPDGVGLPEDTSLCPVCRRPRVNPALAEPSGYSYCYTCLFNYVAEKGCCPISRVRMTTDKNGEEGIAATETSAMNPTRLRNVTVSFGGGYATDHCPEAVYRGLEDAPASPFWQPSTSLLKLLMMATATTCQLLVYLASEFFSSSRKGNHFTLACQYF